jgi:N-acetyl-anhydromuramyl-L-alanine amidase AmpD
MPIEILAHRAHRGGRPLPFVPSPHVGGYIEPCLIVVHDTADREDPKDTIRWFQNPKSKVSAHFVVGRDGSITQMVECNRAAWHAGKSSWQGRSGCNAFAIGIEIKNPGKLTRRGDVAVAWFGDSWPLALLAEKSTKAHGAGWWLPYTPAQILAVQELIEALVKAYPTITDVAAHWEISPGRKVDTNPLFPLAHMKSLVTGRLVWTADDIREAQQRLTELGYWPGPVDGVIGMKTRAAIKAFQEQNGLKQYADAASRPDGGLDQATFDLLRSADAKPAPVGTDAGKAVEAASKSASGAQIVQRVSEAEGAIEIMDAAKQISEAVEIAEKTRGTADKLSVLVDWALSPAGLKTLITLAICIGLWWLAHRIKQRAAAVKPASA